MKLGKRIFKYVRGTVKNPFKIKDNYGYLAGKDYAGDKIRLDKLAAAEAAKKQRESLLKEAQDPNSTIDRQTKAEMFSFLQSGDIKAANTLFTKAKEGVDPKFIARLKDDATHDLLVDMPGAKQTRIDGFVQASMQLLGRR
jgi:hypothetical protein